MEAWLGGTVLVEYMGGQLENGAQRGIGAADTVAEAQLRVKTTRFVLENYNRFGIEVRPNADSEPQFLSWGAVLRIAGTDQEASENPEEERQERAGGADGRERSEDRQELMDRLANARNPAEVANTRAAADR